MSKPVLAMMMAMDKNKLIGSNGSLPWHIPGELAYFKSVTMGKPVLMGRKTFESIGKPLPGRLNIVVTRNEQWQADGVSVCTSLDEAIRSAGEFYGDSPPDDAEIMVIGGAALCRQAMPQTQRLYLTLIDASYEGDTWLDSFDPAQWTEVSRQDNVQGGLRFSYLMLQRTSPA